MDKNLSYGADHKYIPTTSIGNGIGEEVLPDLYCYTIQIVNVAMLGRKDDSSFVLVDAGMPHSAPAIIAETEKRFGKDSRPEAIILTHGHFDHIGAVIELIDHWDVPVYAHQLELPFLTGEKDYPQPDATVEGGMVAKMSPYFPNEAIQLGDRVQVLPDDGTVPHMPGFRWIHTPGHAPGHISFFRDEDRALIAGDAFITVKQDSLYKVFTQELEINGPPRYLTTDWEAARDSVKKLVALKPAVAIVGHGVPLKGEVLTQSLDKLIKQFDQIAIPDYGKYVN
ncbi:MBL fold metallo-hydrolase [Lederbergia galactosidilytica]|uniref:Metallo-beta-lactamase family protein n=1 Tax=Lederbergia galactosidilytica TaxID=217031 RepID=A0A178A056_9BACI|nr:MBL fold metallo-hydrolase [Lederbergia galactosidilytica]KRG13169.1 metallo-beta-lactamase family protein [Virgibacillus soli]MBP1916487.1 glyoxylase-like metal-dependent hydrolase (beta-lactamase superfamily II) [Lederbergia galactosidilytica]OAK73546.1 metallo-beta-lactamase family protein [Lederbergia galactosidilytica]